MNIITRVCLIILLAGSTGCGNNSLVEDGNRETDVTPLNVSLNLGGRTISLVNGYAESQASPDSAGKITTQVWGDPVFADLSGNEQEDAALVLIHSEGGSGTFYYLTAAMREGDSYQGATTIFLGDRIEPTGLSITENRVTVKFLDREENQSFATPPSRSKQKLAIFDRESQQLVPVESDFEGESDPARMTLQMKTWYWKKTIYNNGTEVTPNSPDVFSLSFDEKGRVEVTTDCNAMQGEVSLAKNKIQFGRMAATRMYCEGSQEHVFANMLENVSSYMFTSRGQLVLELRYDSGSLIFR